MAKEKKIKAVRAFSVLMYGGDNLVDFIFATKQQAKGFLGSFNAKIIPVLISPLPTKKKGLK